MQKNPYSGKFIVFEGLDGSGKSTQTKLLFDRLKKEGCKVFKIDFPQHGEKSSGLVDEYLNGKYGSAEEVGPYRASIFYAADRYAASFKIREWLKHKAVVISDRYVASNIAHQGGKIKNRKQRKKFLKWLYNLEYQLFGIPKPDITFILKTSPELSLKLAHKITDREKIKRRKSYLGNKKRDIHEEDSTHQKNAMNRYLEVAKEFKKDYQIIECAKNGRLFTPEIIHHEIWEKTKELLGR